MEETTIARTQGWASLGRQLSEKQHHCHAWLKRIRERERGRLLEEKIWCNGAMFWSLNIKVTSTWFQKTSLLNFTRRCKMKVRKPFKPFKFCRHPSRRPATATCGDESPMHLQQPSPALTQTLRILAKFCIPSSQSSGNLGGMKELKWQMLAKGLLWPGVRCM